MDLLAPTGKPARGGVMHRNLAFITGACLLCHVFCAFCSQQAAFVGVTSLTCSGLKEAGCAVLQFLEPKSAELLPAVGRLFTRRRVPDQAAWLLLMLGPPAQYSSSS